jgi:hypothetical protein
VLIGEQHVRKNFRRIALGAAIAAGGILGGTALALPSTDVSRDVAGGPTTGAGPADSAQRQVRNVVAWGSDTALGLGGVHIGPLPAPTPGVHPEDYVNGGIQTVAGALDKVALGLGGVHIGPLPAPTPGIHPEGYANKGIQTVAGAVGDAALGLGGVHIGPLPAPSPGVIPLPDLP